MSTANQQPQDESLGRPLPSDIPISFNFPPWAKTFGDIGWLSMDQLFNLKNLLALATSKSEIDEIVERVVELGRLNVLRGYGTGGGIYPLDSDVAAARNLLPDSWPTQGGWIRPPLTTTDEEIWSKVNAAVSGTDRSASTSRQDPSSLFNGDSSEDGTSSISKGGAGGGGGMESRVDKLEEFAVDARERLTRIETKLDSTVTKADLAEATSNQIKWMVGTAAALGAAAITVMTFVLNNAIPKAPVQPTASPVTINMPGATSAVPQPPASK